MQPNETSSPSKRNWLDVWGWNEGQELPSAAYVHIPFCRHRCGYCNFSLLANRSDLYERYLNVLEIELSEMGVPRSVETLFLGGGTPSILPAEQMARLLNLLQTWLPTTSAAEWTMECNPLDITNDFCIQIKSYGVNRLSIGGQSFQNDKLKRLERDHIGQHLIDSVKTARQLFSNVSLDLIFAAPNETLSDHAGWMVRDGNTVRLSRQGLFISDALWSEYL